MGPARIYALLARKFHGMKEEGTTDPRRFRVANSQVSRHPRGRLSSKDGGRGRRSRLNRSEGPEFRLERSPSFVEPGGSIQRSSFSTLLASSVRNNERPTPTPHVRRACVKLDGNSGNKSARPLSKDLPVDFKVNTRIMGRVML